MVFFFQTPLLKVSLRHNSTRATVSFHKKTPIMSRLGQAVQKNNHFTFNSKVFLLNTFPVCCNDQLALKSPQFSSPNIEIIIKKTFFLNQFWQTFSRKKMHMTTKRLYTFELRCRLPQNTTVRAGLLCPESALLTSSSNGRARFYVVHRGA